MKILIVDDHELIREGLKKVLVKHTEMSVVGEACDSIELHDQLKRLQVDIIIMDISLPGRSGLDLVNDLKKSYPEIKVLILSMHPEERFAIRALKAGAAGYLTKQSAAQELVKAIKRVMNGGKYISPALAEQLALEIESPSDKPAHELLSNREFEIMRMIGFGKSVSEIGEELSLSVNTVTSYRARIMEKMKMKTNAELIRYAIQHQLVE
jgi:DNA-binding NarL/FixJ family response regulator